MKKRIHATPVVSRDRNGSTMRPFTLRRMLKLTFVSCQPIRSRSQNPSCRARPGGDETLLAGLEEAREDALEMAQEADAPPQARAENASAVRRHRRLRSGGLPPARFHG